MKLFHKIIGEGKPLIILHGLLGTSDNWYSLGRQFAENYQVILVDQRNHGRSPHNPAFTYSDLVGDLNELMQDLSIREATILGHSMGGKVAMSFAQYYPQKVAKLVVVDIAPKKYESPYFKGLIEILMDLDLPSLKSRQQADELTRDAIPDQAVRQFLLKNMKRGEHNDFTWKPNLPVLYQQAEVIAGDVVNYSTFDQPTLFLRGEKSNYIQDEDIADIQEKFSNVVIETVPGAGHWVHAEAPAAFMQVVQDFLAE